MRLRTSAAILIGLLIGGSLALARLPARSAREPAPPDTLVPRRNLAAKVQEVFAARCTPCHGPDLQKPRGRFGYVLDLRRMAANPELVIPCRPDQSELWELVSRNEMPPEDSPGGELTAPEKQLIHDWIAAGASGDTAPLAAASCQAERGGTGRE